VHNGLIVNSILEAHGDFSYASMFPLSALILFFPSARRWRVCFLATGAAYFAVRALSPLSLFLPPLQATPPILLLFLLFLMAHFDGVGAAHRGRGCLLKYILIFETL